MNALLATLRAELYVARRSTTAWLLVLLPAFAVVLRACIVKLAESGQAARDALLGGGDEPVLASNAWGPFVEGFATGLSLLSLSLVA